MKKSIEDFKLIYEFKYNSLREATLMLSRGVSFYLAITAVLVGYVLTQDINAELKSKAAILGIVVSFFALIAGGSISWGIIQGLKSIKKLIEKNNTELYRDLEVDKFMKRGKATVVVVILCINCVLLVFSIALMFII
jgi:hypothetical protein